MSEQNIYVIYDTVAEVYSTPFFMKRHEIALRFFNGLKNDSQSNVGKNPEDFELYCIGKWDENTNVTPIKAVKLC